ncbi:MAG: DMT family transporter [Candidatus Cloacimonetes bacterium]|nr:DMT family transporter [Candidatus Cloacimonadota bacterium]
MINKNLLNTDLLLLISAIIWGFAFVAQRAGMKFIGPFTYNSIRFTMGGLFLIPFIKLKNIFIRAEFKSNLKFGIILGIILFIGSSFQQSGIVYTTAGNAGFITGIYVILVPIMGVTIKRKTGIGTCLGAILAVCGMYFLSSSNTIDMNFGNFLVFISAIFWAVHVLLVDNFTKKIEPLILACIQFMVCSVLCFFSMLLFEKPTFPAIQKAVIPLLYGGFISVGIGFTLQVVAQKKAHPTHAAIILSLEAVFAVVGGILILSEELKFHTFIGCLLMLTGMLVSQLWQRNKKNSEGKNKCKEIKPIQS